ncbi:MAG: cation-transporting P-type ATPase [Hyphomicrobiaceae bacterium]
MNDTINSPRTSGSGFDTPTWHNLSVEETASKLTTTIDVGLIDREAALRRASFGEIALPQVARRSMGSMIAGRLFDLMILVLLAAALLANFVGEF